MSDELNNLKSENENLKKQMAQNSAGVEGLLAQLDAHRGQLNESLNIGLQLRTNVILLQKQVQQLTNQLQEAQKKISELESK